MKLEILTVVFSLFCSYNATAQSLHVKDIIALNEVPRAGTDSFLRSKKFAVCESDETRTVEGHEYSKYSSNCKEPFQEYVTDNYHSGHHITYVFFNDDFYKLILSELQQEGFRVTSKHDIAGCKVTDYRKDDTHKFRMRVCKQDESNRYYLSIPAAHKK